MDRKRKNRPTIKRSPIRGRLSNRRSSPVARGPLAALVLMLLTLIALAGTTLTIPVARSREQPGRSSPQHTDLNHSDISAEDLAS